MSVCNDTYVALGGGDILAIAENPQSAKEVRFMVRLCWNVNE